ncbi:unnamed protein product, partial [Prunus brigantina]
MHCCWKRERKGNDNNSPKALKPMGLKCFFCKKTGHMKKECISGASIYVTNSLQGFIRRRLPGKDEVKVKVDNIGVVRIELDSSFVFHLEDVVYVPSMRKNLISVTRFVKSKFTLNFDDFGCSVFRNKSLIVKASIVDGMFRLNCKETMQINSVQSKPCKELSCKL